MKRLIVAIGLFGALVFPQLQAQTVVMRAEIPFEFHIGQDRMPAGEYVFRQAGGALRVSPAQGKPGVLVLTRAEGSIAGKTTAEFQRYGEVYFLRANGVDGDTIRVLRTS